MQGSAPLFEGRDLTFDYQLGTQRVPALRGVSLTIERREMVGLAGPSGSGKSTLLNLLGLIEPVQGGSLKFEGRELKGLSEREKNRLRRHRLAFIFQSFHLIEVLRADENVEYFLTRQGVPPAERKRRTEDALESVGLWEHRHKRPTHMSGGQRQRVAIARALAKQPEVIIADEPTASLDQATGRDIMGLLRELNVKRGVGIVLSSHDPMVLGHVSRVIPIVDGALVQAAPEVRHAV